MSGHADTTTHQKGEAHYDRPDLRRHAVVALMRERDALAAEVVEQADRIAWLEGEVAGWRIKLAECEERNRCATPGCAD